MHAEYRTGHAYAALLSPRRVSQLFRRWPIAAEGAARTRHRTAARRLRRRRRRRAPVTDLKADEVTVRVGGRTRAVRSLQMIEALPAVDARSSSPLAAPAFGTNTITDAGRTFVLVIADDSFRPGRETPLREAVDLLVRRLAPRDRVSLVTMPYGGIKVPFTTDHGRVRTALSKIVGHAPPSRPDPTSPAGPAHARVAGRFFDTLGIREEPATVMFITAGLAAPRRDAPATMAPGMCELRSELFEQVGVAAGAARAQFYVIQPGDLLRTQGRVQRENIAGVGYTRIRQSDRRHRAPRRRHRRQDVGAHRVGGHGVRPRAARDARRITSPRSTPTATIAAAARSSSRSG